MESILYDVWFSQALPYGSAKIKDIKEMYGNIANFYNGGEYEWYLSGKLSAKDIAKLKNEPLNNAEKNINLAYKLGYKIISLFDGCYPKLLEKIYNPPGVLYVSGDVQILNEPLLLSVVGTRKASNFNIRSAYNISRTLASGGVVVVSGGAVGIDSAAHRGALSCGGKTILVLGCGINYPYLMYNKKLRDEISKSGAVISEFPPNYPCNRYTFPIRNRIISGISKGTVVIEAGEKSGSLITANCACEQNRDVFVFKGERGSYLPKGSMLLARDGAKMVSNAEDILNEYSNFLGADFKINNFENLKKDICSEDYYWEDDFLNEVKNEKIEVKADIKIKKSDVPEHLKEVYNEISKGKIHIDALSVNVHMPVYKLLPIITELELLGFIKAESGRTYSII